MILLYRNGQLRIYQIKGARTLTCLACQLPVVWEMVDSLPVVEVHLIQFMVDPSVWEGGTGVGLCTMLG